MTASQLMAGIAICALLVWVSMTAGKCERFVGGGVVAANADIDYVNKGPEAWNHHPISSSLPMDIVTKSDKPYYYEYDNAQYDIAITKTFQYPCKYALDALNTGIWSIVDLSIASSARSGALVAHQKALEFIDAKLNTSEYMQLPYDNPDKRPKIQIVHDVLVQAKQNTTNKYSFALFMELVLYREAKYNGKHVGMTVLAEYDSKSKKWTFNVVEANVIGVVYEDNIGLFPVVASYKEVSPGVGINDMTNVTIPSPDTIVEKQQQLVKMQNATSAAMKGL